MNMGIIFEEISVWISFWLVFCCYEKLWPKSNWGVNSFFGFQVTYSSAWREVLTGTQGRNLRQELKKKSWRRAAYWPVLLIYSATFLSSSDSPARWWHHPQWAAGHPQSRKCPQTCLWANLMEANPQLSLLLCRYVYVCVKLRKPNRQMPRLLFTRCEAIGNSTSLRVPTLHFCEMLLQGLS